MGITLGGHGKAKQGVSTPTSPIGVTFTLNAGETGMVDVIFSGATVGSVNSITNGGTWSQQQTRSNGIAKIERWTTGVGGASSASSISIAYTVNGSSGVQAIAAAYQGVDSFGSTSTGIGTASNPSIAITTQDSNNWVVGGFGFADGSVATPLPTAGTGNLREADNNSVAGTDDSAAALVDNTSATTGLVNTSVTFTVSASTKWVTLATELRAPLPPAPVAWLTA